MYSSVYILGSVVIDWKTNDIHVMDMQGLKNIRTKHCKISFRDHITNHLSPGNTAGLITSRVSGRGHRIGAVLLCVCLCVCLCVFVWHQYSWPLTHMTSHNELWGERTRKCLAREVHECSGVFIVSSLCPQSNKHRLVGKSTVSKTPANLVGTIL